MKRLFAIPLISIAFFFLMPQQEAKAQDPITMGVLAPYAISAAQKASPFIMTGLKNAGKDFLYMGLDIVDIFRLPIGMFEIMFLWPLDTYYIRHGLKNMVQGSLAPFKLAIHAAILPVCLFGLNPPALR